MVYGLFSFWMVFLKYDLLAYDDDGYVYEDCYVFKDYDFGELYNLKKLKEM